MTLSPSFAIFPELEAFVLERTTTSRIPSLSLVLLDGDATYERHFGFRDLESRVPPDGDTRYGIGSVTKLLTALATLRLVEGGAFGLDEPLERLLPEIAGHFPAGTAPRHLLSTRLRFTCTRLFREQAVDHLVYDRAAGWRLARRRHLLCAVPKAGGRMHQGLLGATPTKATWRSVR